MVMIHPSRSSLSYFIPFRSAPRVRQRGFVTISFGGPPASGKSNRLLFLSGLVGGAGATIVGGIPMIEAGELALLTCVPFPAGYAFYHWSGLKDAVDFVRHPIQILKQKAVAINPADQSENTAQLFTVLRQAAKAYVVGIPGAGILVDVAFNEVEKVVNTHKNEVRAILKVTLEEIQEAAKARGRDSKEVAWNILAILRVKLGQVQALASAAGQDKIAPLFDQFPGFHEHADRILGVRASLLPVYQKGLEKVVPLASPSHSF